MNPAHDPAPGSSCARTREQEFVIGGYVPGTHGFDAILVGVYDRSPVLHRDDASPGKAELALGFFILHSLHLDHVGDLNLATVDCVKGNGACYWLTIVEEGDHPSW